MGCIHYPGNVEAGLFFNPISKKNIIANVLRTICSAKLKTKYLKHISRDYIHMGSSIG
jgi:hypothetical protein